MKCSIIDRFTICFDHLATPLQHTIDQSFYATLIQVGPGPLQNALEFLQRGIVLVGFPLDVIPVFPEVLVVWLSVYWVT